MNLIWSSFATPVLMICIVSIKPSHICPYESNNFEMHLQKLLKYLMCLEFTCRTKPNFRRTLHLNVEKNLNKFPWAILFSHFSFFSKYNCFKFLLNDDNFYKESCCGTLLFLFNRMFNRSKGCSGRNLGSGVCLRPSSVHHLASLYRIGKLRLSCEGFWSEIWKLWNP